jgi:hypothetical protein
VWLCPPPSPEVRGAWERNPEGLLLRGTIGGGSVPCRDEAWEMNPKGRKIATGYTGCGVSFGTRACLSRSTFGKVRCQAVRRTQGEIRSYTETLPEGGSEGRIENARAVLKKRRGFLGVACERFTFLSIPNRPSSKPSTRSCATLRWATRRKNIPKGA